MPYSSRIFYYGGCKQFATISPEKIGENLKRLIKESEYRTQERFAEEAFVDVRTVRRWVKNGIDSISTVAMVADILDVDVKALLFRGEPFLLTFWEVLL